MTDPVSYGAAQSTCRDYVCSACWGDLDYKQPDPSNPRVAQVFCTRCGDATPGLLRRRFAEWLTERNEQQLAEARYALRDTIPWLKVKQPKLSEAELIKSLGF